MIQELVHFGSYKSMKMKETLYVYRIQEDEASDEVGNLCKTSLTQLYTLPKASSYQINSI